MPLPPLNAEGELPEGVHRASMDEVVAMFGTGTPQRVAVTARLLRVYNLVRATGDLDRLVIFGSYVTKEAHPNDVDVVMVLRDGFRIEACDPKTRVLFDHREAAEAFGASIFWIRPSMLILETLDDFIRGWQTKRDGTRRGIVEVSG